MVLLVLHVEKNRMKENAFYTIQVTFIYRSDKIITFIQSIIFLILANGVIVVLVSPFPMR